MSIAREIARQVEKTPFVDTHEHLLEETTRLRGTSPEIRCDDWAFVLSHYFDSDLLAAGMPEKDHGRLFSPTVDPLEKWRILEPWWPLARHTGYGRAVAVALRELYDVDSLSARILEAEHRIYPAAVRRVLGTPHRIVGRRVVFEETP